MNRKQINFSGFADYSTEELSNQIIQDLESKINVVTQYHNEDLRLLNEAVNTKDSIKIQSMLDIADASGTSLDSLRLKLNEVINQSIQTMKDDLDSDTLNQIDDSTPLPKSKLLAQIEIAQNTYNTRLKAYDEAIKLNSGARVTITKEQLDLAISNLESLKMNLSKWYPDQEKPEESNAKAETKNSAKNQVNFPYGIAAGALVCIVAISLID